LLRATGQNSLQTLMAIQNDVYSRRAGRLKQVLNQVKMTDPAAEEAKQILIQWSGEIKEGLASAIYEVFWGKLEELTFSDDFSFYYRDLAKYFEARQAGLEKFLTSLIQPGLTGPGRQKKKPEIRYWKKLCLKLWRS